MRLRPLSWSMRFAAMISGVFALAAVSAGGVSYYLQSGETAHRLEADVEATTEALAFVAQNGDMDDLTEQIDAQMAVMRNASNLIAFIPKDGGAILGNASVLPAFTGARHLKVGIDMQLRAALADTPEGYVAYAIRIPEGLIVTGRDDEWLRAQAEMMLGSFGWGLGIALLLSTGVAVVIARRSERRVQRMEDTLTEVGHGEHGLRIADTGRDDIARLAQSVDRTLDQLEDGISVIRQVSTDIAHDLRAPLARLRLRLEPVALDDQAPMPVRQEIGRALSDLDQVSETFDAILRLARMQAGMVEIALQPVDLSALCAQIHEMMEPIAEDLGHRLALEMPEGLVIQADRELLTQAIVNLIDNATRHCPTGAVITLAATQGEITVSDTGPGIPEPDLARVRERFVRLDRARNTQGSGLGLSLVEAIASLHGARLELANLHPGLQARIALVQ
ncbi:HAMP domain-containing sensor histidine kinase (plasmid) [Thioclava litoralis]|uniref:histidine kinase n=1 Tax=Thioclava litoralis TaxID=3076557 RepID=A0ABZ1E4T1_9RHOB|nr:HAMP domain-containing sensor histidine kinase [Thioclava sp. FTW29]